MAKPPSRDEKVALATEIIPSDISPTHNTFLILFLLKAIIIPHLISLKTVFLINIISVPLF
jgi:hypothetical protein